MPERKYLHRLTTLTPSRTDDVQT